MFCKNGSHIFFVKMFLIIWAIWDIVITSCSLPSVICSFFWICKLFTSKSFSQKSLNQMNPNYAEMLKELWEWIKGFSQTGNLLEPKESMYMYNQVRDRGSCEFIMIIIFVAVFIKPFCKGYTCNLRGAFPDNDDNLW